MNEGRKIRNFVNLKPYESEGLGTDNTDSKQIKTWATARQQRWQIHGVLTLLTPDKPGTLFLNP